MSTINFQRTYPLGEIYYCVKNRTIQLLEKYLDYPNLYIFNDSDRCITFLSERLIPCEYTGKPRVMLLFSNPHPYSVYQGMFLSPSIKGMESLFWSAMRDAGWIKINLAKPDPKQLADICLNLKYQGPFDLIFYCYYAFPTSYPEDIKKIFGKEYFKQFIEQEAMDEFQNTIQETGVEAVVTFNKGIFNLVSMDPIGLYTNCLMEGELIRSEINGIDRDVPVFLTFPTGWRYHKEYMRFHSDSLNTIRKAICTEFVQL